MASTISIEVINKEKEYLNYIENHVNRVKKAYNDYFVPLLNIDNMDTTNFSFQELKDAIREAEPIIDNHDLSKYSSIEFYPYRMKYYPTNTEKNDKELMEINKEKYKNAWIHHYKNNPHHPEYWVNDINSSINDMELKYIVEMLCDWMSFGDNTKEWYENKAVDEKEAMSERTKLIVEELMDIILK